MAVAAELGLSLNNHRSQPLTRELVRDSDLIVALTRSHADIIVDRFPDAASVTVVLGSFVADAKHGTVDVPDPISSSLRVYRQTRDQIAASLAPLASFLAEVGKRGRADSR
jgi:protein-tyrosine phosphatase